MKCEECLPLIEEYVDGELDGRTSERLGAHLSACAACADELATLKREQEVYANYRRDLEVTPAHWNVVRARIEQEKEAAQQPARRTSLRQWLTGLFGQGLRPFAVAALVLAVVAVTAILVYQRSRGRQDEIAVETPTRKEEQTPTRKDESNGGTVAHVEPGSTGDGNKPAPLVAGTVPKKKSVTPARVTRTENQTVKRPTPDNSAQFEEAIAESSAAGARGRTPVAAGDFDFEISRHAGRAELLLRSFRNVRPAPATAAVAARRLDVSFEKEQARRLLYRNIALRRAAAERGDPAASELLNTLEPILLDIANLPGRAGSREVQSIERRMEKKEIVAALQVRTLLASN